MVKEIHAACGQGRVHVKSEIRALQFTLWVSSRWLRIFCEKYDGLIRDFWWGDEEGKHKVHWMSCEQMVKPKRTGGIGSVI